jgi:hypothetical protein
VSVPSNERHQLIGDWQPRSVVTPSAMAQQAR